MRTIRSEHPKPQFYRTDWSCLNGEWQFEIDNGKSGLDRGFYEVSHNFSEKIIVPFCPESKLSGIHHLDFMNAVWYKRTVYIPSEKLTGKVILHFGAVDYYCMVFVNGQKVGSHKGGYSSFKFDITDFVVPGDNVITVYVEDDSRNPYTPSGKQCSQYYLKGCFYTRTTGIWQTVWLEFVPNTYIESIRYYTDAINGSVTMYVNLVGTETLSVQVKYKGKPVGSKILNSVGGSVAFSIELSEIHLWEIGKGRLYDVDLSFGPDRVYSYFGLRSIRLDGKLFLINERPVFQRLVLDQGYYPDGVYTAPSDEALQNDIKLAMAMGFNGARLHQKVFEERFLYHCDRMGYIVWEEYGSWGLDHTKPESIYSILPEWISIVNRDFNHPSIIGWCPFNETWDVNHCKQYDDLIRLTYEITKNLDYTRPCIDTSGNYHVVTDIFDLHDYEQDPVKFKSHYQELAENGKLFDAHAHRQTYQGQPVFISEFGGILWAQSDGWGYGNPPKTEEEFLSRFKGLVDSLLDNPKILGFCYTQLTDVEQEKNGLYTYSREPKFLPEVISKIISRKAAIEE
jgi:beta-galactosidase/beta-glucuronidase